MSAETFKMSRAERLERLRGQLQGVLPQDAKRKKTPPRGANLLWGAMLHGAARLRAGLELTDLEARLVGPMIRLLSEDEVRDFGQVYAQEADSRSRIFPDALAARPIGEGYTSADLFKDLASLHEEIAAQPNVNVIDLNAPTDGGEGAGADSQDFRQGMADYGYGATLVTASGHQARAEEELSHIQAKLTLDRFYTIDETDEWSGSDEIYWATTAASDAAPVAQTLKSGKFGGVDEDEIHRFPANTIMFDGLARKVLTFHIQCWEEDEGPPRDLMDDMREIGDLLHDVSQELEKYAVTEALENTAHFVALLGGIASLIANIMDYIHDDLVGERTFVFNRAAMEALAADPGHEYSPEFETNSYVDGRRNLTIKGTAVIHSDKLAIKTYKGGEWCAPILPWATAKTPDAPAVAIFDGSVYCAIRGMNDRIYVSKLNGTWTAFEEVPNVQTRHAPALASFMGKLYLAYTAPDSQAGLLSSTNGRDWVPGQAPPGQSLTAPALAVRNSTLHIARSVFGIYTNESQDGATWSQAAMATLAHTVTAPALACYKDKLYLAYRDAKDGGAIIIPNGTGWEKPVRMGYTTADAPSLAARNNLVCTLRHTNNSISYGTSIDGTTWGNFHGIPGATSLSTPVASPPYFSVFYRAIEG
ncbi:hypothetical protein AS594_35385 [Streptomyces agglomeratus]|uniref:Uncharacterized protein n=1 Tax=Streptomyces agglomeratus TaxID=285458 RepID=A0A1E5PHJ3_9ACTN|nr:hypothetical protein [Streptomyces agglomeratus]OEJ28925.1 hypothetical protein AS594_35385 [Streptomyces agglomeratus]